MKRILSVLCIIALGICSVYAINVVYSNVANSVYGEYIRTRGNKILCTNVVLCGADTDIVKIVEVGEPLPVDFEIGKYKLSPDLTTYILIGE